MKDRVLKSKTDFEKWKEDCLCSCDIAEKPKEFPCVARTYVSDWSGEEETAEYLYKEDLVGLLKELAT